MDKEKLSRDINGNGYNKWRYSSAVTHCGVAAPVKVCNSEPRFFK